MHTSTDTTHHDSADDAESAAGADSAGGAPPWLRTAVHRLESDDRWDPVADSLGDVAAPLSSGTPGRVLRGEWLGHALHPLMTDLPLGCWQASLLLDLLGGRSSRKASRRLVGLGVLAALPTAATGLAEMGTITDARVRRVAAVHASGNTVALGLYAGSYRARRRGRHLRGVLLGLTGGSVAMVTGYLGGHMSFTRGAGVGDRGIDQSEEHAMEGTDRDTTPMGTTAPGPSEVRGQGRSDLIGVEEAAEHLTMAVEQVHTLVDQGVLDAAERDPLKFRPEDVDAVRMMGG